MYHVIDLIKTNYRHMKLVFATHNINKFNEVQLLLPKSISLLSLTDINCKEEIEETATTIEGNATLKARYVFENYGYNCFADDTGLEVSALDGAPGVYSARYAGPENNAEANMNKLLAALNNHSNRKAHFKTVIALQLANNHHQFTGIAEGEITTTKIGLKGFGYDPIFKPNGFDTTFAALSMETKNNISHRGKAIQQLTRFLAANF